VKSLTGANGFASVNVATVPLNDAVETVGVAHFAVSGASATVAVDVAVALLLPPSGIEFLYPTGSGEAAGRRTSIPGLGEFGAAHFPPDAFELASQASSSAGFVSGWNPLARGYPRSPREARFAKRPAA
jgi:hypothetical protein